jgi:spore coat polysaccharide biosynthesis predicted glycosyltransferase SpsG
MKIIIVTDGNNKLGMGHVYQSLTLAGYLLNRSNGNIEIKFFTKSDHYVVAILKMSGCEVVYCENDDEILSFLEMEKPEKIIFDKLDVSPSLAKKIKEQLESKLLIFTNLTSANDYADVTLLADIGSNFKNIYGKNPLTGKVEIFGPKYWILRPEFFKYQSTVNYCDHDVEKIMLIFGGSDPANLSTIVLKELLGMNKRFKVSLVLGSGFSHCTDLDVVMKNNNSPTEIKVFENINNIAEMMSRQDVVFTSPGLSFFESLAVGTPVIGFHQNELQKKSYQEIIPTVDKENIGTLVSMISNKEFIFADDEVIKCMEIGEGIETIIEEILLP